jgi:hypothetical protein
MGSIRSFFIRGLAVLTVIFGYAVGSITPQVAGVVGLSSFVLATSTQPAAAWRRYRRYRRVRRYRRYRRRW